MNSFKPNYLKTLSFHPSTTWHLNACAEFRGMQEMWKKVRPEALNLLRESALIQSAESSNRIEGVEVEKDRLRPLVIGQAKPRDRSEEEIVGYRKALAWIHEKHDSIEINPETIKRIHQLAQDGSISDAGKWKEKDNDIIEIFQNGERRVRFKCLSAKETPAAIEQLCLGYRDVVKNSQLPELISVLSFIMDFLCIHPFRDGNGRVSRLLLLLLLYQHHFEVGRYMSLERLVEETKDDYYRVLGLSSENWHSDKHDLMPWWNYSLGVIKSAYKELQLKVSVTDDGDSKSSLIRQMISSQVTTFSVADLLNLQPGIDRELIKKVLSDLKKNGVVTLIGRGRGARWKNK